MWEPKGERKIVFLPKIEVYQNSAKEWEWRMTAINHKIIGASSEGFDSKRNALANLKRVADQLIGFYDKEKDKPE